MIQEPAEEDSTGKSLGPVAAILSRRRQALWRIDISRFSIKIRPLRDLCASNESCFAGRVGGEDSSLN